MIEIDLNKLNVDEIDEARMFDTNEDLVRKEEKNDEQGRKN